MAPAPAWAAPTSGESAPTQVAQAEQALAFDIAAQPLRQALLDFGTQSGLQVAFAAGIGEGLMAQPVRGRHTPAEALRLLLGGSGLSFEFTDGRTVTVTEPVQGAADTMILNPLLVEAESDQILVQDGYVPLAGRIGSKTDTPLIKVPQAVSVVTERQLDDREPQTLNEVLEYVPGVNTTNFGFNPRYDTFVVRGVDGTYNGVFRDGLRQFQGSTAVYTSEPYGMEGVAVLKGPSSTLYGATSAGGFANVMTKRPTKDPLYEIEGIVGSHDRLQGNVDVSDAVTEDGSLRYRATAVLRDAETEMPGVPDDRQYIAPALTWEPSEDTRVTVLGSYLHTLQGGANTYYNANNTATDIPNPHPDHNEFDREQYRVGWEIDHRINDTFTVRQNARYSQIDIDLTWSVLTNPATASYFGGRVLEESDAFVIDNHVETRFETGALSHTVLTGIDYGITDRFQQQGMGVLPIATPKFTMNPASDVEQSQELTGVYMQDQMAAGPWLFVLGGRYDWLDAETVSAGGAPVEHDASEFSWRTGISYVTDFGLVPYANYTTSFTPNVGTVVGGDPAKPTTAEQVELGVKYEFPDRNALLTAAVYQIDQTDGVVWDAATGVNRMVQQDLRSRGVEIELVASLAEGLDVTASYAYNDLEIVEGATGTDGNTRSGSPHHMASVYADYTVQSGAAAGLAAGAGVRYQSESWGNDANTFKNDPRYFVDANLRYDLGQLSPQLQGAEWKLHVDNLLDQDSTTCTDGYCYRDPGRTFLTSVRYRF
ncbi:Ferrichrome-iron receptor [Caenispirillum salinarum AK4]|uniref:Ferrichrome-iron receptor n=1 Tax=Caenispirillum salinarum AK4 TaxID=1238182 RepID=K9GSJ2_9PROT|nr:TonB-dependent siderophore receptor [Caenispirillum salinarum]EKV28965.1 Ferrichrome-iron receptor [Caenispirillum salinarum AK4]